MIGNNLKDVINNAEYLFSMHPAPWGFYDNGFDGYIVDSDGGRVFGGEPCEGRVADDEMDMVALVDVVNSLWVYMRDRK